MTYTTDARYEVGVDGLGSISGYCRTWKSASANVLKLFELAKSKYLVENPVAYIFDRMAHKGKAELWYVVNGDLIVKSVRNG